MRMTNMDTVYIISLIRSMISLRVRGEWDAAELAMVKLRECGVK